MGRFLIVGCGVDPHFVARAVDELGSLGHPVEVVTSVEKARELMELSQPAPKGLDTELEAFVLRLGIMLKGSDLPSIGQLHLEEGSRKSLLSTGRERYGSKRSRAGRAARWG